MTSQYPRAKRRDCRWPIFIASLLALASIVVRTTSGDLHTSPDGFSAQWHLAAFLFRTVEGYVALLALMLAVLVCLRRARLAGIPLAVYAASILWSPCWSIIPKHPPSANGDTLRILGANLEFDESDTDRLLSVIAAADPDMILFQECTPRRHAALIAALTPRFPHQAAAFRDDIFGQAVFSRHAFVDAPELYPHGPLRDGARTGGVVGLQDPQIRVTLLLNNQPVVVQCVHLAALATANTLTENRRQAAWLADWAAHEPRGVVIMGDHNFTARSVQAATFRAAGLREAHASAGRGPGATWPDTGPLRHLPGFRIDQAYTGNGLVATESRVLGSTGSDHRPVLVNVGRVATH